MEIRERENESAVYLNNPARENRRKRPMKMNFWTRTMFQRIFLKSLCRLIIYLYKLYEDFGAVQTYRHEKAFYFEVFSLLCLILPSSVFAIYQSIAEFIKNDNFSAKAIFTKFVNGLLLIPWQIKRHLDSLYFSSQNLCSFRKAKEDEKENLLYLNRNAETLEFFEDFYAGFIQVVMQIYILALETENKTLFILGEVIGSGLSIMSMLIAVKRRDDGILTGFLSYVGWISMFISRVLVFALASLIIKHWIILLCLAHALGFTIWVHRIAMRALEDELDPNVRAKKRGPQSWILVFFFFGLPSLVLWPYMFHLKEKKRPMIFLVVIIMENLILAISWFLLNQNNEHAIHWLLAVLISTIVATLFLSLYFFCKPSKTDQVVLINMRYTDTDSYGIYFEFCEIVFNLSVQREVKELLDVIHSQPELALPKHRKQPTPQTITASAPQEIDGDNSELQQKPR